MRTIAPGSGLSDFGLRKACKRAEIPIPKVARHPMMGVGEYGGWYIGGLLFMLVVAGAAGAIVAAVHNAIAPKT